LPPIPGFVSFTRVKGTIFAAAIFAGLGLMPAAAQSNAPPPLYDPVFLNIGFVCRWEGQCIADQKHAMKRSLKFVRKEHPPTWRVHLCNRNASRKRQRVDWIGFDHCIRNEALRPPPPVVHRRRARASG